MSLGVIMVLGSGKSAKLSSWAVLIEEIKKKDKKIQQGGHFDHLCCEMVFLVLQWVYNRMCV